MDPVCRHWLMMWKVLYGEEFLPRLPAAPRIWAFSQQLSRHPVFPRHHVDTRNIEANKTEVALVLLMNGAGYKAGNYRHCDQCHVKFGENIISAWKGKCPKEVLWLRN